MLATRCCDRIGASGRDQNGAVISLYPGVFDIRCEIWVCDVITDVMHPDPAFVGESTVDYTTNTGRDRGILIYAIDVRTPVGLSPFEQNFAPMITSLEINPQTASIGETVNLLVSSRGGGGGRGRVCVCVGGVQQPAASSWTPASHMAPLLASAAF